MPNFLIIARREYLQQVKAKSFIIMTLLFPLLMFGALVLPHLLMMRGAGETRHFVIMASNAGVGNTLRDELTKASQEPGGEMSLAKDVPDARPRLNLVVDVSTDTSDVHRAVLTESVKRKELDGFIVATNDALTARKIVFYTGNISSIATQEMVKKAIGDGVSDSFLTGKGLTQPEIERARKPVELDVQSSVGSNPLVVFFTVMILVVIVFIAVVFHSINVMRAVLEEKTSRVMEVMLATARPIDLMAGKLLGVGAVGLTQMGTWAVAGILLGSYGIAGAGVDVKGILSAKLMLFFGLFFLLGFTLYSALCAALGAMVNSEQEAQQLQLTVMLPLVLSALMMQSILQSPNSATAVWASLFPLTAPLDMFLRIAIQSPPLWQVLLSIGLMVATAGALLFLCARIYRVGILMYGKRPTLPEIVKWVRYA